MNAGCYGGYIWEKISSVFLISKDGKILEKKKDDFVIKYRSVDINKNYFFLKARFKLSKNSFNNSNDLIKEYLKDRRSKQPTSLPSCGSVFKNPDNCHAAYLIDSIGLKGYKIGGAYISKKHANFIISDKTAKSIDVENLIYYVQQCVYEKKKIFLEPEVKFIGNK